jgi:hypothetical protein
MSNILRVHLITFTVNNLDTRLPKGFAYRRLNALSSLRCNDSHNCEECDYET